MVTGGKATTTSPHFQIHRYNLDTLAWELLLSSPSIRGRWGHVAALLIDPATSRPVLFVSGGRDVNGLCDDMWEIALDTMVAKAVPSSYGPPSLPTPTPSDKCDDSFALHNPNQRVFAGYATMAFLSKFVVIGGAMAATPVRQEASLTRSEISCFTQAIW